MVQEELKKYTSSYRNKMINELKTKLNKDTVIDDSINEIQTESQFLNFLENNRKQEKINSIISKRIKKINSKK